MIVLHIAEISKYTNLTYTDLTFLWI